VTKGHANVPFHHKYSEQGQAKALSGRKQREMIALVQNIDPSEVKLNSKKHFKGNRKRGKAKAPAVDFD
jgi:large subunit GTPase 1